MPFFGPYFKSGHILIWFFPSLQCNVIFIHSPTSGYEVVTFQETDFHNIPPPHHPTVKVNRFDRRLGSCAVSHVVLLFVVRLFYDTVTSVEVTPGVYDRVNVNYELQ